ncbi:Hypothetical predicted protein [Pelobates cultripes]|uniref:Uncharacterized protein n=1 Tax=Pelobates cultripes TaxID=61616 RepID=A0AAD1WRS8_PELCU|nr:Hypothetical predicted protein [Pelobates cultripes]
MSPKSWSKNGGVIKAETDPLQFPLENSSKLLIVPPTGDSSNTCKELVRSNIWRERSGDSNSNCLSKDVWNYLTYVSALLTRLRLRQGNRTQLSGNNLKLHIANHCRGGVVTSFAPKQDTNWPRPL